MTWVLKNVYVDKLNDIVNKYNNKYHTAIKMRPIDVKSSTYFDFDVGNNDNDHVRIFKYKNILQIGQKTYLLLRKVKNTVPWTYVVNVRNGENIVGTFYEK